jgi:hypothetical protein
MGETWKRSTYPTIQEKLFDAIQGRATISDKLLAMDAFDHLLADDKRLFREWLTAIAKADMANKRGSVFIG